MERIYLFITFCIACLIGAGVTLAFGLHPACMAGTIIFILAIVLSLEFYFKERREKEEQQYVELIAKDKAVDDFMKNFGIDRARARGLYDAGFHELSDFRGKTTEELMQIENINPTLANRIVRNME
jgi:hypothetical protein